MDVIAFIGKLNEIIIPKVKIKLILMAAYYVSVYAKQKAVRAAVMTAFCTKEKGNQGIFAKVY